MKAVPAPSAIAMMALGGSDVFGEVEVVAADVLCRRRDADGEVIRAAR